MTQDYPDDETVEEYVERRRRENQTDGEGDGFETAKRIALRLRKGEYRARRLRRGRY